VNLSDPSPLEELAAMAEAAKELHREGHGTLCDRQLASQLRSYFHDEENEMHDRFPRVLKVLEEELHQ